MATSFCFLHCGPTAERKFGPAKILQSNSINSTEVD